MTTVCGMSVDIAMPDGVADAYVVHPTDGEPRPGILMYMDVPGVRPALTDIADRIASAGYTVLLPNLFYRHGRAPVVPLPDLIDPFKNPEQFAPLFPIMHSLTTELAMRDTEIYLRWLAESPLVKAGPFGIAGYCFGGALALHTAGTYPDRVAAVAGFHAGHLATEDPDSPHLVADRITAEVYFGHADNDPILPPEQVDRLEKALSDAGVRHRCEVYPGAQHGFATADTAFYDEELAERHWVALLDLLDRTL
jgi:carboxymethylenebutenolidase